MKNHPNELQPVEIELPYSHGVQLCEFLEAMLQELQDECDGTLIDAVCEKVADANVLAIWRRESVAFDLQPDEAVELLEALTVRLDEDACSEAARPALGATKELLQCIIKRPHSEEWPHRVTSPNTNRQE